MHALASWMAGNVPWFVVVLLMFRPRFRFARIVEGKKVRTELEISINGHGRARRSDIQ